MNSIIINKIKNKIICNIKNEKIIIEDNKSFICSFNHSDILYKNIDISSLDNILFYLPNNTYLLFIIQNDSLIEYLRNYEQINTKIDKNQILIIHKININLKIKCSSFFKDDIYFKYTLPSKTLDKFKVLAIMDEFTYTCYKYEFELIILDRKNWKKQIEYAKPDLFLCESVWDSVKSNISLTNSADKELIKQIINFCYSINLPSVFWNKEDDINYNKFIESARLFDYIFTTDIRCIPFYKKDANNNNVYCLEFAAQPKIHNPSSNYRKKDVFFAGRWYNEIKERNKDIENLINLSIFKNNIFTLDIFDRKYIHNTPSFPNTYLQFIKKKKKYSDLCNLAKKYKIMLNVNTITKSSTMFSRRVYEGLATGCCLISSYSLGIQKKFNNIVKITKSKNDSEKYISYILNNKEDYNKLTHLGYTTIMNNETYKDRFKQIIDTIGLKYYVEDSPIVHIILVTNKNNSEKNIIDFYKNNILIQSYKNLTVTIFTTSKIYYKLDELFNYNIPTKIFNTTSKDIIIKIISNIKDSYISVFNLKHIYNSNFIRDTMYSYLYVDKDTEMVGKKCIIDEFGISKNNNYEHQYVDDLVNYTIIFNKNIIIPLLYSLFNIENFLKYECKKYSVEKWNFIYRT